MKLAYLSETAQKAKDLTLNEYIAHHTDAMSSHIFGLSLPQIKLPEFLSFLNNGVVVDGHLKALKMIGENPVGEHVFQITAQMVIMLLAGLLIWLWAATSRKKGTLTRKGHALEALVVWVRDELAVPNLGEKLGRAWTPFLLTQFFFILVMNYLSLIPNSATPTSNITLTAVLAIFTFLVTNVLAIKQTGVKNYIAHLTGGTHWAMWPIMIPIEVAGIFTKPFALAIRLFANMTAGHIIIYALLGLVASLGTVWVAPVSVGMALFVNLIELLVCFLQAFIFTMLSALFIGLATHTSHDEEAAHEFEAKHHH